MASEIIAGQRVASEKICLVPIFSHLPPIDLWKFFTICKRWSDTILEHRHLHASYILGCIEHSNFHRRIPQANLRNETLGHIVIVQLLRRDLINAWETLKMINEPNNKVCALIEGAQHIEAQMRGSAKQKVGEVILPILGQAKNWLETKFQYREQKIPEVVKMEAAYDPDLARQTCDLLLKSHVIQLRGGMQQCFERDLALFQIFKVYISSDPPDLPKADAILGVIERPKYKIRGLCEIGKHKPEAIESAKALLPEVMEDQRLKDGALLAIATAQALYNPYVAETTASQMYERVMDAYLEIARGSFSKNPQLTKEWAAQIKPFNCQITVQFEIAMMEKDYQSATNFAEQMINENDRANAWMEMAKKDLRFLTPALKRTREVKDVGAKVSLLIEVAKLDPDHNFNEAKKGALGSRDRQRDDLLAKISEAEAVTDPNSALTTAGQILNSFHSTDRVEALLKIAEVDGHDSSQTRGEVRKKALSHIRAALSQIPMTDLHYRVQITCKVAQMLLRNYQPLDPNFSSFLYE